MNWPGQSAGRQHSRTLLAGKSVLPGVGRAGDCVALRALDRAIFDGFVAGLELGARARAPRP